MSFFMQISLPRDLRHAATARLIVAQSAQDCGCDAGSADAFADRVEDEARTQLARESTDPHIMMGVERKDDTLVVTIDSHVMQLALA
jgi:hypothetical protein